MISPEDGSQSCNLRVANLLNIREFLRNKQIYFNIQCVVLATGSDKSVSRTKYGGLEMRGVDIDRSRSRCRWKGLRNRCRCRWKGLRRPYHSRDHGLSRRKPQVSYDRALPKQPSGRAMDMAMARATEANNQAVKLSARSNHPTEVRS